MNPATHVTVALVMAMLAGCAGLAGDAQPEPGQTEPGNAGPDQGEGESTEESPGLGQVDDPRSMQLQDCWNWNAFFSLPSAINPIQPPPGWERTDNRVASTIEYRLFRCQQIHWGSFDRGPVDIIIESSTKMKAPPPCESEFATLGKVLAQILFSDPELVEYARDEFGLPAYEGRIRHESEEKGPASHGRIEWKPEGDYDWSNLGEVYFKLDEMRASATPRLFWDLQPGIGRLDWNVSAELDWPALYSSAGTIKEPMHLATAVPGGAFAGRFDTAGVPNVDGSLIMYEDYACEKPY